MDCVLSHNMCLMIVENDEENEERAAMLAKNAPLFDEEGVQMLFAIC